MGFRVVKVFALKGRNTTARGVAPGFPVPPLRGEDDATTPQPIMSLFRLLREGQVLRLPEVEGRGEDFLRVVNVSERRATDLESSLRPLVKGPADESRKEAGPACAGVGEVCTTRHAQHG